ncbi:MAG: phosphodiester glycosidase family protein [Candidatus Krumholzibacteriota bacterium]
MKKAGLALLAVIVAAATAVGAEPWTELEAGLELARFDSRTRESEPWGDLVVLRVDPTVWDLKVVAAAQQGDDRNRDIREWSEDFDLAAAINAGMYQADKKTHVGFCQVDGDVISKYPNKYRSAVAFDPLAEDDPPFRIFDLDETPLEEIRDRYRTVVQNLRLIKRSGKNRWEPSSKRWREAALGEDARGRALLISCRFAWSMHDFNEILLELPLDLVCAQHLEGSGTARFWLNHPAHGEWKEPGYPGPNLPIILGVTRPPAVSGTD